jgi:HK97 family phage prohead protease
MKDKYTKNHNSIVKDVNAKSGVVVIQISQFNKYDSDKDRMLKGAFTKTFKEGKQVHLVDHKMGTSTFVGLPIKKDPENLVIESQLNLEKEIARELLSDYEFGLKHNRSLQHSHGFMPIKDKYTQNDKGGYDFKEVNMFEYSTVIFGAESDTPLIGVKNLKDEIEQIEKRLRYGFMSDSRGKELEIHIQKIKDIINTEPSDDTHTPEPLKSTSRRTNTIFN